LAVRKSSLVQEVKARFEHFVDVVGYKGRVNVDNDGNPEIVTNDRPGMAPSDIDSLKQKADELDQQLEKLTDKMEEIITAQSQAGCHAWSIISHNFWITVIINIDSAFVAYDINKMFKPCFHFLNQT
jgi:hypothetical protein